MTRTGQYSVKVLRSLQEIEEIRSFWEKVQYHPNTDIDLYMTTLDSTGDVSSPYIILFSVDGQPEALAIGRLEKRNMGISFGYKTFYQTETKCLTILYTGLLGNWSNELYNALIKELMNALRYKVADIAWFNLLNVQSDPYNIARKLPIFFCRDHAIETNPHWVMTLPDSFDAFLKKMTAKHRYWLNRLPRVIERDYPGKVVYKYFQSDEGIELLFEGAEIVARKSYQRTIGAGFADNNIMRQRLTISAKQGHLRAYLLYVDKKPCAFWIGTLYGKVFYLDFTSYDPAYKRYEPGTILFMKMVEDIISNKAIQIDFGFGNALYKQRFGNQQWIESSVYLYAPTIRGIVLNIIRYINIVPQKYIMRLAERTNILNKIKKLWRTKLIGSRCNNDTGTR